MAELSGAAWVARYPTSHSLDDLVEPFRSKAKKADKALKDASASVAYNATLRPKKRAWLMHYAWLVARGHGAGDGNLLNPTQVPAFPGLDIDWTHAGNFAQARKAAEEMVRGYGIVFEPAIDSRHTDGRAIDAKISWTGTLKIRLATGTEIAINSTPRDHTNVELIAVLAGYGLHRLPSGKDPVHFSDDAH